MFSCIGPNPSPYLFNSTGSNILYYLTISYPLIHQLILSLHCPIQQYLYKKSNAINLITFATILPHGWLWVMGENVMIYYINKSDMQPITICHIIYINKGSVDKHSKVLIKKIALCQIILFYVKLFTSFIRSKANKVDFLNFICHFNNIFSTLINSYKFFIKGTPQ